MAQDYFQEFVHRRVESRLPVKLLTNRTPASIRTKSLDTKELRETRFVPEKYRFHTANYILDDTIAILSLKHESPAALIIEDPEIAKTQAMYFELLWTLASTN